MADQNILPVKMPIYSNPPPYLLAIEQLQGHTPGEKFHYLYDLAHLINTSVDNLERGMFDTSFTGGVPESLVPLFKVIIAKSQRMDQHIAIALHHSDPSVWKQALRTRWFFDEENEFMDPLYMVNEILPSAAIGVRMKVIKKIALAMYGYPRKAERGFGLFENVYGLQQSLPMLVSCGQKFVINVIKREKIVFSERMLNLLFRCNPDVVLYYLLMALKVNTDYKIPLDKYTGFLPKIIKDYPIKFAMLYEYLKNPKIRLSNNKTKHFLSKAKSYVIVKPRTFLKMLPLEFITKKLTRVEFEEMFKNFFPKDPAEFNITEVATVLTYIPQDMKLIMLLNTYAKVYQENLFNNVRKIFSPALYQLFSSNEAKTEFLSMFFNSIQRIVDPDKTPPHILLQSVLKQVKEFESSNNDVIGKNIEPLIKSCALFNDQVILYKVLCLLQDRQNHDSKSCLNAFNVMAQVFDLSKLTKEPWKKIAELLLWENKHLNLTTAADADYGPVMRALVHHLLSLDHTDKIMPDYKNTDAFVEISIRCFLKHNMTSLFIDDVSDKRIALKRIDSFINKVRGMFIPSDSFWTDTHEKLRLVIPILKNMHDFNVKHGYMTKKLRKSKTPIPGKQTYDLYPWFQSTVFDLLKRELLNVHTKQAQLKLRDLIRVHDPENYYEDIDIFHDVTSIDALNALKHDHLKLGLQWESYAESCYMVYPRSKTFLRRIKWYGRLGSRIFNYAKDKILQADYCAIIAHISNEPDYATLMDWWHDRTDKNHVCLKIMLKAATEVYPPVPLKVFRNYMKKYPSMRPLIRELLIKVARKWNREDLRDEIYLFVYDEEFLKDEGARLMSIVGTENEINMYNNMRKKEQEIIEDEVYEEYIVKMEHD